MSEARRQNEWPTPPLPVTASHCGLVFALGAPVPPGAITLVVQAFAITAAGFGAVPVVSRRPMIDVTGPNTLTCPMAQSESRSAHGVVHCPTKMLPKLPWNPAAELREARTTAWVASRSSGAFCSIWNHAVNPALTCYLPRTPKLDDGAWTSAFDTEGTVVSVAAALGAQTPVDALTSRSVKPSLYFAHPNVGYTVPYTSTLACASARPGAANAPATATVRSFFCMHCSSLV